MAKSLFKKYLIFICFVFMINFIRYVVKMKGKSMNLDFLFTLEFWAGIIISIVGAGIVYLLGVYLFLRHVPENTYKKIDELINQRLSNQTTNHDTVMGALSPSNQQIMNALSPSNRQIMNALNSDTQQIYNKVDSIHTIALTEQAKKDSLREGLDTSQKCISDSIQNLSSFSEIMIEQNNSIKELKAELLTLRQENAILIVRCNEYENEKPQLMLKQQKQIKPKSKNIDYER